MPVHFITTPAADRLTGKTRIDGWSPALRAGFLTELAEGAAVSRAVEAVGMGVSGLYALRQRDALFEAAWDAARLLTRERLRDTMIERAFDGEVHVTRKDGEETVRRRRNYRLSLGVLDRLEQQNFTPLARLFAGDFETVVSLIGCGADGPRWRGWLDEIDHDLPLATLRNLFPLAEESAENEAEFDIWEYDEGVWRTDLPPPPGFAGRECGRFGDDCYDRDLSEEEEAVHRARLAAQPTGAPEPGKIERGRAAWSAYFGCEDASAPPAPGNGDGAWAGEAETALGPLEIKSMKGLARRPASVRLARHAHRLEAAPVDMPLRLRQSHACGTTSGSCGRGVTVGCAKGTFAPVRCSCRT